MDKEPIRYGRYLLFAGDFFYPAGGFNDFINSYESIESAEEYKSCDWYQIVDSETYKIVKESRISDDGV